MKRRLVFAFLLVLILVAGYMLFRSIRVKIEIQNCDKMYADNSIKLPDKEISDVGFTCTGLYWDQEEKCFLIGNAGKYTPDEENFQACIEIVEKDFSSIKRDIPCYLKFENMRDIQGVTKSKDGTIWLCSYGENRVRQIDESGNEIKNFAIKKPSGIAYDGRSDTLWILTNNCLCNCSCDGIVLRKMHVHIKGQDQIFLDEKSDLIYFSSGVNGQSESYIYTVNLKSGEVKPLYVLKDSYAIEGIAIVDNVLYVLNDGYYHNVQTPVNQVNIYFLNSTHAERDN